MALLAGAVTFAALPAGTAAAADGPAPTSTTRAVIADVHTDAIATFWDDGRLELGSKADTPVLATRYDSDHIWFHVDDDSQVTLPAGFDFVAPGGSTIWLAPETQQSGQIWPGFSTESVPSGVLDDNDTTLTLIDVDGPGDLELWTTGSFGAANRLWSSDEPGHTSFTRKRAHMHANWAFTAAGVYRVTVQADATVEGTPVGDAQVYTFVVGGLPEQALTTTRLAASHAEVTAGEPVTLSASVSPAAAEDIPGAVEFRDGTTVLGHDPIDRAGTAELRVPDLSVGTHQVTATFVPETTNLAAGSTSPPVAVTVVKADATVRLVRVPKKVARGAAARFRVVVRAEGVTPTGKVVVQVAGRSRTVRLDRRGRATARIVLSPRQGLGTYRVTADYRGDGFVRPGRASARVAVVR